MESYDRIGLYLGMLLSNVINFFQLLRIAQRIESPEAAAINTPVAEPPGPYIPVAEPSGVYRGEVQAHPPVTRYVIIHGDRFVLTCIAQRIRSPEVALRADNMCELS